MTGRVTVHVVPRARRTELAGLHGNAVKVRVAAPPVEGAANAELIRFIAERLGVPRRQVEIAAGVGARDKVLLVSGMTSEMARGRLTPEER